MKLSEFGKKARAYRLRHGWLLYDMACVMRISSAQLSAYEVGKRDTPADVWKALETLIACEGKAPLTSAEVEQGKKVMEEIRRKIRSAQRLDE